MFPVIPDSMAIARREGAWIETDRLGPAGRCRASPLARGRGLKLSLDRLEEPGQRSPLARGRGLKHWIALSFLRENISPLARGRGLKLATHPEIRGVVRSPLARGRGLKHFLRNARGERIDRPSRGGVD